MTGWHFGSLQWSESPFFPWAAGRGCGGRGGEVRTFLAWQPQRIDVHLKS